MDNLVERFEEDRTHLRAVAYRMLGSRSEAEDAVQEAWLRLSRSGADDIENLRGWLSAVVARVCLDQLRARKLRREEPLDAAPQQKLHDLFDLSFDDIAPIVGRSSAGCGSREYCGSQPSA
jgi:DNA-directed RNA polymerase specialized sigma24 family protein